MPGRRNRKRTKKRQINWPKVNWVRVIGAVSAVIVIVAVYISTLWVMDRPIDKVVINGTFERVSADHLEQALAPYVRSGFVTASLPTMRNMLLQVPWVKTASVRRRWPGTLEVSIVEERAVACWQGKGLLNADGQLFVASANHVPAELPRLSGPDGSEAEVAGLYFDMQAPLEQRGLTMTRLKLQGRGAWEFELSNGIRVQLGSRQLEQRLARFFVALDRVIAPRSHAINYVDMRYTNGFAIGWKEGQAGPNV